MSFIAHAVITGDGSVRVVGHGEHVAGLHVEVGFTVHDAGFVAVACADDQESADDMALRMAEGEQQRRTAK